MQQRYPVEKLETIAEFLNAHHHPGWGKGWSVEEVRFSITGPTYTLLTCTKPSMHNTDLFEVCQKVEGKLNNPDHPLLKPLTTDFRIFLKARKSFYYIEDSQFLDSIYSQTFPVPQVTEGLCKDLIALIKKECGVHLIYRPSNKAYPIGMPEDHSTDKTILAAIETFLSKTFNCPHNLLSYRYLNNCKESLRITVSEPNLLLLANTYISAIKQETAQGNPLEKSFQNLIKPKENPFPYFVSSIEKQLKEGPFPSLETRELLYELASRLCTNKVDCQQSVLVSI